MLYLHKKLKFPQIVCMHYIYSNFQCTGQNQAMGPNLMFGSWLPQAPKDKAVETGIILLIDQVTAVIFVRYD